MTTIRKQARFCGWLYFLMGVTAPISLLVVPGRVFVSGDAAATAERLRQSESLLRLGIGCELFHQAIAVYLVLALYRLFKRVDVNQARHLVALGALVSVPIMFLIVLNELAALTLAQGGGVLAAIPQGQLEALAYLFMRLHGRGITIASIFWGLWLVPFGLLVIRSGFIPKVIGWLLLVAAAGYVAEAFAALVVPAAKTVVDSFATILEIGEIPVMLWLLILGARGPRAEEPAAD
jgi:hypothetical protein